MADRIDLEKIRRCDVVLRERLLKKLMAMFRRYYVQKKMDTETTS